jgi:hypothetical protein
MRNYIEIYQRNKDKIEPFLEYSLSKRCDIRERLDDKCRRLFEKFLPHTRVKHNQNISFTKPYKNFMTGNMCVTIAKKEGEETIFLDYDLEMLLERLGLLKEKTFTHEFNKSFYIVGGFFLLFFGALVYVVVEGVLSILEYANNLF